MPKKYQILLFASGRSGKHLHALLRPTYAVDLIDLDREFEFFLDNDLCLNICGEFRDLASWDYILYLPSSSDSVSFRIFPQGGSGRFARRAANNFVADMESKIESHKSYESGRFLGNLPSVGRKMSRRSALNVAVPGIRKLKRVITNSVSLAGDFVRDNPTGIVAKLLPDTHGVGGGKMFLPARVSLSDLEEAGGLELPILLEEEVRGAFDFRCYHFGDHFILLKWERKPGVIDVRGEDAELIYLEPTSAERLELRRLCDLITEYSGLKSCVSDFVWSGAVDDTPALVDINPYGSWQWLPMKLKHMIDNAFLENVEFCISNVD